MALQASASLAEREAAVREKEELQHKLEEEKRWIVQEKLKLMNEKSQLQRQASAGAQDASQSYASYASTQGAPPPYPSQPQQQPHGAPPPYPTQPTGLPPSGPPPQYQTQTGLPPYAQTPYPGAPAPGGYPSQPLNPYSSASYMSVAQPPPAQTVSQPWNPHALNISAFQPNAEEEQRRIQLEQQRLLEDAKRQTYLMQEKMRVEQEAARIQQMQIAAAGGPAASVYQSGVIGYQPATVTPVTPVTVSTYQISATSVRCSRTHIPLARSLVRSCVRRANTLAGRQLLPPSTVKAVACIRRVRVTVSEARGLAPKLLGILAKRDPFFTLELGEMLFQSNPCHRTQDPVWNQSYDLYVVVVGTQSCA